MSRLEEMAVNEAAKRYPDTATPENNYLGNMPQIDDFIAGASWLANFDPPDEVLDAMMSVLRGDRQAEASDEGRGFTPDEKEIIEDWQHRRITNDEMWKRLNRCQMRRMWKAGMEVML